jgi:hypothetical protein
MVYGFYLDWIGWDGMGWDGMGIRIGVLEWEHSEGVLTGTRFLISLDGLLFRILLPCVAVETVLSISCPLS